MFLPAGLVVLLLEIYPTEWGESPFSSRTFSPLSLVREHPWCAWVTEASALKWGEPTFEKQGGTPPVENEIYVCPEMLTSALFMFVKKCQQHKKKWDS